MPHPLLQIDAFADEAFAGNPAAVCFPSDSRDAGWMQSVAVEMNLSETAFLEPRGGNDFGLRWFTPGAEVDLCGHATLASAHALWESGRVDPAAEIRFHTLSGVLTARSVDDRIELDFPSEPASESSPAEGLIEALGCTPVWVGQNRLDYLIEVADEASLQGLSPDFRALRAIESRGFIVTSRSQNDRFDFLSRYFAPFFGIDEDPVTGSAHCCLAPYWAAKLGKTEMTGFQASARGGTVGVELAGDRVKLRGQAVTVLRGELL